MNLGFHYSRCFCFLRGISPEFIRFGVFLERRQIAEGQRKEGDSYEMS